MSMLNLLRGRSSKAVVAPHDSAPEDVAEGSRRWKTFHAVASLVRRKSGIVRAMGLPIAHSVDVDGTAQDPFHHRHFHFHRQDEGTKHHHETDDRVNAVYEMEQLVAQADAATQESQQLAPPPSLVDSKAESKGWQGSTYSLPLVDGIHEHRAALDKRRKLRLLPEINNLVGQLWSIAVKRGVRMHLRDYMDFHLSCYFFVTAVEENCDVDDLRYDSEAIDVFDCWENAILDWRADTEEALELYGNRSLHYDSFRDSVFELIDMYTTTTDEKQYIGYMRKLVRQIGVVEGRGRSAVATRWHHPWPRAVDSNMVAAFQASLKGGDAGAAELGALCAEWCDSQLAARKTALDAHAAEAGETLTEEQVREQLGDQGELLPRGLAAAYASRAALDSNLVPSSPSPAAVVGLLRVLDVDLSGGVSEADLKAGVVDGAKSQWNSTKPIQSRQRQQAGRK